MSSSVRIEPAALPADRPALAGFVAAIQEHERAAEPDLKAGEKIAEPYVDMLIGAVTAQDGVIFIARAGDAAVGFAAAWIAEDDDPLLRDDARRHAYVSDIYVAEAWRRHGVASALLQAVEAAMRERSCRRLRICSKAGNEEALGCYAAYGFQPYEVILTKDIGAPA